jgi:hypothetical protein
MRVTQAVNFRIFAVDVTATLEADPSLNSVTSQIKAGKTPSGVVASQPVAALSH